MLIKDIIEVKCKLTTKASKLINLNTKDFFIQFHSISCASTYQQDFIDEVNHILFLLDADNWIKLSDDKTTVSGLPKIEYVQDHIIIPATKEVLLRDFKPTQIIDHVHTKPTSNTVLSSPMPFDTYVATKYLGKLQSAMTRGIEFKLTLDDMKRLLKQKKCYYSGVTMTTDGDLQVSLDRKDSKLGYTKDNTVACCALANSLKNELIDTGINIDKVGAKVLKSMLIGLAESIDD